MNECTGKWSSNVASKGLRALPSERSSFVSKLWAMNSKVGFMPYTVDSILYQRSGSLNTGQKHSLAQGESNAPKLIY